ncbi:MAG: hypothetical protein CMM53_06455 [Rhodospirillaceae bacterium]|nr:hypothetical protein [Rhodospirillaceae bacterium]
MLDDKPVPVTNKLRSIVSNPGSTCWFLGGFKNQLGIFFMLPPFWSALVFLCPGFEVLILLEMVEVFGFTVSLSEKFFEMYEGLYFCCSITQPDKSMLNDSKRRGPANKAILLEFLLNK